MFFDRKPAHPAPQEDLANLKITDARVKDTLSVNGAAEDFTDIDFTVDRLDSYEAGSQRWIEVSGTWRDGYVELTFSGTWPDQPGTVTATLAGWIDGDAAKGRMKVEGRADGRWSAVRKR